MGYTSSDGTAGLDLGGQVASIPGDENEAEWPDFNC